MHRLGIRRNLTASRLTSRCITTSRKMERTYDDAIAALNTLQSNFSIVDAIRKSGKSMNKNSIPEMIEWCRRLGYEPSDFDRLRPIHISGTKGKGSTSALISSILAQYLPLTKPNRVISKIGLYTSPHLRFVRERIQINNEPLSEEAFAKYFFETWDRLEDSARAQGRPVDQSAKPAYFRFLTLMAFHTYVSEGVDTAIIECGIGGEYDSTNIIVSPTVTGITSLGIDHVAVLGETIEEIAWHKAGIMKPGAPAFTVPQPPAAQEVLQQRAAAKSVNLEVVQPDHSLADIPLGLAGAFQVTNASLAVRVASAHLLALGLPGLSPGSPLPVEFVHGLRQVRWPGRCETRSEKNITWHIDSGHTLESIQLAAAWFAGSLASSNKDTDPDPLKRTRSSTRILLFNQQTRDADALARSLYRTIATALDDPHPFTHVVFCTNRTFVETGYKPDLISVNANAHAVQTLEVQNRLAQTWADLDAKAHVQVVGSINEAVRWIRNIADAATTQVAVLVTGSVHLVGGFLEVLETEPVAEKPS